MTKYSTTVGMDLGDKTNRFCVMNEAGDVVREGQVACTKTALRKLFGSMERCLVAIEAGAQSPWVSVLLGSLGHEVLVGNPRQLPLITRNRVKTDARDAEWLARIARLLVQSARYILGPFAKDSALRDWGLGLMARGGKNAKKRAAVAVARKLAVLLHRLWTSGECWQAYPQAPAREHAA